MKIRHHFAHQGNTDCSGGPESILHRLAKSCLLEEKAVSEPAAQIKIMARDDRGEMLAAEEWIPVRYVMFRRVDTEVAYEGFRPDVVAEYTEGGVVFIEIRVTSKVSQKKKAWVQAQAYRMFEIDLSGDMVKIQQLKDVEELKEYVLNRAPRKWVFNPEIEQKRKLMLQMVEEQRRQVNQKIANEKAEATARATERAEQIETWRSRYREQLRSLSRYLLPSSKNDRVSALESCDQKLFWEQGFEKYGLTRDQLPPFLTEKKLDYYQFFTVPETVWRTGIYVRFVAGGKTGTVLDTVEIATWCVSRYALFEPMQTFWPYYRESLRDDAQVSSDLFTPQEKGVFQKLLFLIESFLKLLNDYRFLDGDRVLHTTLQAAEKAYRRALYREKIARLTDGEKRELQLATMEVWSRRYRTNRILRCQKCAFVFPEEYLDHNKCCFCGTEELREYDIALLPGDTLYNQAESRSRVPASLAVVGLDAGRKTIISLVGKEVATQIAWQIML